MELQQFLRAIAKSNREMEEKTQVTQKLRATLSELRGWKNWKNRMVLRSIISTIEEAHNPFRDKIWWAAVGGTFGGFMGNTFAYPTTGVILGAIASFLLAVFLDVRDLMRRFPDA